MQPHLHANFDVAVLFFNRVHQTKDCILSFLNEDTQPNIVVLDQGSAADQRMRLEACLSGRPEVRIVTLAANVGVAAGRNRLCRECSADWTLFVDNDIGLGTAGGVEIISSAVAAAPDDVDGFTLRLLNVHENRFVDRMQIESEDGLLRVVPAGPDAEKTNVFPGGAVVLRRSLLIELPYDVLCRI